MNKSALGERLARLADRLEQLPVTAPEALEVAEELRAIARELELDRSEDPPRR